MKDVIFSRRSTNGRYGIDIIGNITGDVEKSNKHTPSFIRGYLIDHGVVGRIKTFEVVEDATSDEIVVWGGDIEPIDGAVVVFDIDLQSSDNATVLVGNVESCAVVEYGYKRRSSHVFVFRKGKPINNLPPSVMKVLGFLPGVVERVKVDIPPPDDRIAQAFNKLGL